MASPGGQRLAARIFLLVSLASLGAIAVGLSGAIAVDKGGGALVFAGLVFAPGFLFAWRLYARRAAILDRLLTGDALLRFDGPDGSPTCVSREGALVEGELHTWGHSTSRLEQATFDEGARRLVLTCSMVAGRGGHRHRTTLEIAVPPGQEAAARQTAGELAALTPRT